MAEKKSETVVVRNKGRFIEMGEDEAAEFVAQRKQAFARTKGVKPELPVIIKPDGPEFKKALASARGEDYDTKTGSLKK